MEIKPTVAWVIISITILIGLGIYWCRNNQYNIEIQKINNQTNIELKLSEQRYQFQSHLNDTPQQRSDEVQKQIRDSLIKNN